MDIEALLRRKLIESLGEVDKVDVVSEGGSCSAAAKVIVTVVSKKFEGASRLQRHRMVHEALSDELKTQIHAITIKTVAPSECSFSCVLNLRNRNLT